MNIDYDEGLRMAQLMKAKDQEIREAIDKTQTDGHGVVALKYTEGARYLKVEILDLPYESDVRVYPSAQECSWCHDDPPKGHTCP